MSREMALLQIRMCHQVVKTNVGDATHEESLRSFAPAGNCLNWVLGHLVTTRSAFLEGLGAEPVWSKEEGRAYDRHAAPLLDAAAAKPLDDIWRAYDLSQQRLLATLGALTPERLAEKLPPGLPVPVETVEEMVGFLGLHDAYHTGQTGMIRRLLGHPPADL